jgi:prepilin-type N-terminal cleavage/methylation domain-containing protein
VTVAGIGRGGPGRCPAFLARSFHLVAHTRRIGYTLIEVIVVLMLLTIAASVVAPALFLSPEQPSSTRIVIGSAREAAVRRGEMVQLRVDASGRWQVLSRAFLTAEPLLSGRLSNAPGNTTDLFFSALGTCAPSPESALVQPLTALDPLTCESQSK